MTLITPQADLLHDIGSHIFLEGTRPTNGIGMDCMLAVHARQSAVLAINTPMIDSMTSKSTSETIVERFQVVEQILPS